MPSVHANRVKTGLPRPSMFAPTILEAGQWPLSSDFILSSWVWLSSSDLSLQVDFHKLTGGESCSMSQAAVVPQFYSTFHVSQAQPVAE